LSNFFVVIAIHLDGIGSNVADYVTTVKKLTQFAASHKNIQKATNAPASAQVNTLDPAKQVRMRQNG
jgi:hypothetical protein